MAGFIPAIHVSPMVPQEQTWMAGTSPAMTEFFRAIFTSFCWPGISKAMRPPVKEKCPALRAGHSAFSQGRDD